MTCPDTVYYDWATATLTDNTTGAVTTVLPKTCTSNAWSQVFFRSLVAGHGYTLTLTNHDDNYPGDPSYTLFDDVALTAGASMRLVKVNRGMATQVVGEWPRAGTMTGFALTTGATGSILLSSWNASSYAIGELLPDPSNSGLHLRGLYSGATSLAAPAQRELRGVSVWPSGASTPTVLPFGSDPNPPDLAIGSLSVCF